MKTRTQTRTIPKTPFFAAFSVGAVLFSAHAGGGFATGNQANTYYVGLGWAGIVSAIVAMLLLTLTMREAMIMYNSRGLTSYKQLFETLYHPIDKIEWLFEIFFYIMVLMAVAAAISGAASALRSYFGVNYYLGVVAVTLGSEARLKSRRRRKKNRRSWQRNVRSVRREPMRRHISAPSSEKPLMREVRSVRSWSVSRVILKSTRRVC